LYACKGGNPLTPSVHLPRKCALRSVAFLPLRGQNLRFAPVLPIKKSSGAAFFGWSQTQKARLLLAHATGLSVPLLKEYFVVSVYILGDLLLGAFSADGA